MKELASAHMDQFDNFSAGLNNGLRIGKHYLDTTIEAAMVIAGKNLYMNQPMEKYLCVGVCLHKTDGSNQVLNCMFGTEPFKTMSLTDFIINVAKTQNKKIPAYVRRELKLNPDEITSADIKIFTDDDMDTITAELKQMGESH